MSIQFILIIIIYTFYFYFYNDNLYLLSFPTRRSSDLRPGRRPAHCRNSAREGPALRLRGAAHRPQQVAGGAARSEEHTSELQSRGHLVCRLLLEKKKKKKKESAIQIVSDLYSRSIMHV